MTQFNSSLEIKATQQSDADGISYAALQRSADHRTLSRRVMHFCSIADCEKG